MDSRTVYAVADTAERAVEAVLFALTEPYAFWEKGRAERQAQFMAQRWPSIPAPQVFEIELTATVVTNSPED